MSALGTSQLFAQAESAPAPATSTVPEIDASNYGSDDSKDTIASHLHFLPATITDGLDVNVWGWISYLHDTNSDHDSYWDGEVSLNVTKSFADRFSVSVQGNFIDANTHAFGQLEQAFASLRLSESTNTILTVGKFNASFGVEQRDFWNRLTGTTSLLFGAQPQDLIGVMLTQPIGESGFKLRPFIANQFEGHFNFNQPPSGGLQIQYSTQKEWSFSLTNWVGPGLVPKDDDEGDDESDAYNTVNVVTGNWLGPKMDAQRGGTLYFVDANATWMPRPDLTLAAEGLMGTTGTGDGRVGWAGALVFANFDITDHWRVFGRWSFLDDFSGLVTGTVQHRHELSGGFAYRIYQQIELRAEYRHDFSAAAGDLDSVSVHLSFGY